MQSPWLTVLEPALPPHCEPSSDFLLFVSRTLHTCVPTPLAFASNALGSLSIVAWLFAQLPQIYKNWTISSTSGLSIFFLVEWFLGDLSNLLGALFTHQATWQVCIGAYYVFVDMCLVSQWFWYEKLRHRSIVRRVWRKSGREGGSDGTDGGGMQQVVIEGVSPPVTGHGMEDDRTGRHPSKNNPDKKENNPSRPQVIFRAPARQTDPKGFGQNPPASSLAATPNGTILRRVGSSSSFPWPASPSPRTMLFIACLAALAHASPAVQQPPHTATPPPASVRESAGTLLSWLSTLLYLGSRLPQLLQNYRRKSTAGLSPLLFLAAFCGNMFYSLALLADPRAWSDLGPYGGGGWVGAGGSDSATWRLAAAPFFLGAAGVLGMDGAVGVQFILYGDGDGGNGGAGGGKSIVIVEEEGGDGERVKRRRWRRVSGWMRGWVPNVGGAPEEPTTPDDDGNGAEQRRGLLSGRRGRAEGYGSAGVTTSSAS